MKKKGNAKTIIFYILLIAVIVVACSMLLDTREEEVPTLDDVILLFERGVKGEINIESCMVANDGTLSLKYKEGDENKAVTYKLASISLFYEHCGESINTLITEQGMEYEVEPATTYPWWVSLLPTLGIGILFIVIWIYMMNQATGKNGKIAKAIRTVMKAAASVDAKRVNVEIR